MGNLKQRLIKPGRDYNYAEGVKVKASVQVRADQIVVVSGSEGPYLKVQPADADDPNKNIGRLMIAKHDIPVNGYGVVLPWKLVTTMATNTSAVGNPVFLHDTVTDAVAGNLTLTAPTDGAKAIVVGRVSIAATVANGGAILVHADAPESRVQGGILVTGVTGATPRPMETLVWAMSATTTTVELDYPVKVLKVSCYKVGTTDGTLNVYNGAGTSKPLCAAITQGTAGNTEVSKVAFATVDTYIPAGTAIRAVKDTGDATDRLVLHVIRA